MPALGGTGGSVYLPSTPTVPIAQIRSWTLTTTGDVYDCSVLGDQWAENVGGLKHWNGALNGYYALTTDTTGQRLLYSALINSSTVVLVMSTAAGGGSFEGTARITSSTTTDPVDNVITIDFNFIGNSSLQVLD